MRALDVEAMLVLGWAGEAECAGSNGERNGLFLKEDGPAFFKGVDLGAVFGVAPAAGVDD